MVPRWILMIKTCLWVVTNRTQVFCPFAGTECGTNSAVPHGRVSDTLTAAEQRILKSSILLQLCSLVPWRNACFLNGTEFCLLKLPFYFIRYDDTILNFFMKTVCVHTKSDFKNPNIVEAWKINNKEHFDLNILILMWQWNIYSPKDHPDSALHNSGLNFGGSAFF